MFATVSSSLTVGFCSNPPGNFSLRELFAFLQGFFEKTGGKTWFFDGEFVVESW